MLSLAAQDCSEERAERYEMPLCLEKVSSLSKLVKIIFLSFLNVYLYFKEKNIKKGKGENILILNQIFFFSADNILNRSLVSVVVTIIDQSIYCCLDLSLKTMQRC